MTAMQTDEPSRRASIQQWLGAVRRPAVFVGVVGMMGFIASQILHLLGIDIASMDVPRVAKELRAWGPWCAFASISLMILHSVLPLPAEVITIANGLIFGPLLGAMITWIGAMLGAVAAYAAARYLGLSGSPLPLDARIRKRLEEAAERPAMLLALRLVPLISFNLINYAVGLLGVGWWPFLWTTAIGILPMTLAMSYFGHAVLEAPLWIWVFAAAMLLVAPLIAPLLLDRGPK